MYEIISTYDKIKLKNNSLLIFDIDDTIMKFDGIDKEWWKNKNKYYYDIFKDYDKADNEALIEWINHIEENKPQIIDNNKLFNIFHKAQHIYNCEIIFMTSRDIKLKNTTEKHFYDCNISEYIHKIYYSKNKGILLKELLKDKYKNYRDIIFIDDNKKNLEDVYLENKDTHNLSLYLFN